LIRKHATQNLHPYVNFEGELTTMGCHERDVRTMRKRLRLLLAGLILIPPVTATGEAGEQAAPAAPPAAAPTTKPDLKENEQAIRATVQAFADAFEKKDVKAIVALFTENAEAIDTDGDAIQGRAALEEHYASRLGDSEGDKLAVTIEKITMIAPGVARQAGFTQLTPGGGGTPIIGRYSAIYVKDEGRWKIANIRELGDKQISHYEHLKELEWLVGEWVEETPEAVVSTSFAWTDDKNFLLRSFDVRAKGKPALTGTQRIGWDPLTKQIKSWVFDSRGGYGEGLWTRADNQWVVKATGVRPDGRVVTATQVLTYVDQDNLRWKSIDRTLGDEIVNEIDEIVMVKKPPQPK
jgi:uncharacterized protein (TIGR02246 family)